jgi:hypothetical protein
MLAIRAWRLAAAVLWDLHGTITPPVLRHSTHISPPHLSDEPQDRTCDRLIHLLC